MRDLTYSDKNSIAIFDKLSGSGVIFYYRTPTTKERVQFNSEQARAANKFDYDSMYQNQINWAQKILTGFSEDSFGIEENPISSNPKSKNYNPEWKKLLEETSSDLLFLFVRSIMGDTSFVVKSGGVSEDFFTKSSGNGTGAGAMKNENTTKKNTEETKNG